MKMSLQINFCQMPKEKTICFTDFGKAPYLLPLNQGIQRNFDNILLKNEQIVQPI
jgi:hypothetical protein